MIRAWLSAMFSVLSFSFLIPLMTFMVETIALKLRVAAPLLVLTRVAIPFPLWLSASIADPLTTATFRPMNRPPVSVSTLVLLMGRMWLTILIMAALVFSAPKKSVNLTLTVFELTISSPPGTWGGISVR